METREKYEKLKNLLRDYGSGVLAFSGGVDSSFLAGVAVETLGDNILLVTATSPTYTAEELETARRIAERIGARFMVIETHEFDIPDFVSNPPDRCYFCKKELYGALSGIRTERKLGHIFDGTNADDTLDYRPGKLAAVEFDVRSPLLEAGLTKLEIRELSRELGLPTWNHPQRACLASRLPYGSRIDPVTMKNISSAENMLYSLGFSIVRVRHHGETARIEVHPDELSRLMASDIRTKVSDYIHSLGYKYVAVDVDGYITGSMNKTLPADFTERSEKK